jgi:hypothetical protein
MNKKDFELTRDFWKWAAEDGTRTKYVWHRIDELLELCAGCAFCEYFYKMDGHMNKLNCKCPLGDELGICNTDKGNIYGTWDDRENSAEERQKAAWKIYEFTDKYIRETFPEE